MQVQFSWDLTAHCITTANLLLVVNISGEPQILQDSIVVGEGSEVTLECTGSGSLLWTSSAGQEIPTGYETPGNLYQEYISSREVQLLHIRNFSSSDVATYKCKTNLTTVRGDAVEVAVTLKGGMFVHFYCEGPPGVSILAV